MGLFSLPPHYVFDYKPRFYDPNKERRKATREQVRRELGLDSDPNAYKYSINFRHQAFYHKKIKRRQNTRLAIILALLLLITYLLLYTNLLDSIAKAFVH